MVAFSTSSSVSTVGVYTYTDITLIFDFSGDKLCNGMVMRNHLYAKYPVNQSHDIEYNDIETTLFEYKQLNTGFGVASHPQGQNLLSLVSVPASPAIAYDYTDPNAIASVYTAYAYSIDTSTGAITDSYSMTRIYYRVIGSALIMTDGMIPYFCVELPSTFKAVFSAVGLSEPSHAVFVMSTAPLGYPHRGIKLNQLVDYADAPYADHMVFSSSNDGKLIGVPSASNEARIVTDSAKNFFVNAGSSHGFLDGGVSASRQPSVSWDFVVVYNGPSSPPSVTFEFIWSDTQSIIHTDTYPITWSGPSTVSIGGGAYTYYVYTATGSTSFTNFPGATSVAIGGSINNNGWIFQTGKAGGNIRPWFSSVPASGPDGSWIPAVFYKI